MHIILYFLNVYLSQSNKPVISPVYTYKTCLNQSGLAVSDLASYIPSSYYAGEGIIRAMSD